MRQGTISALLKLAGLVMGLRYGVKLMGVVGQLAYLASSMKGKEALLLGAPLVLEPLAGVVVGGVLFFWSGFWAGRLFECESAAAPGEAPEFPAGREALALVVFGVGLWQWGASLGRLLAAALVFFSPESSCLIHRGLGAGEWNDRWRRLVVALLVNGVWLVVVFRAGPLARWFRERWERGNSAVNSGEEA